MELSILNTVVTQDTLIVEYGFPTAVGHMEHRFLYIPLDEVKDKSDVDIEAYIQAKLKEKEKPKVSFDRPILSTIKGKKVTIDSKG